MKLQDFHFELFEWPSAAQQAILRELRQEACAAAETAHTATQATAATPGWHVLARDMAGHALGCGHLAGSGTIECVVVREGWHRQGIGTAILGELIARARTRGMREVTVHPPVGALEFYRRAGFAPSDANAGDAGGLQHIWRLAVVRQPVEVPPPRDPGRLAASSRAEVAAARRQLLTDARHQVLIHVPSLAGDMFANPAELEQLRRIACSGRSASVRILLHDPAAAVATDHPLLPLLQRLPTAFQIRTPTEAVDLAYASAYLLNDAEGYLFLPDANRPTGRAARHDRAAQAPLRQYFNEVWERAERATILNTLDL